MGTILRDPEEIKKLQPKPPSGGNYSKQIPGGNYSRKIDFSGGEAKKFRKKMGMKTESNPEPEPSTSKYFDNALDDSELMDYAKKVFEETAFLEKEEKNLLEGIMYSIGTNPESVKLTASKLRGPKYR